MNDGRREKVDEGGGRETRCGYWYMYVCMLHENAIQGSSVDNINDVTLGPQLKKSSTFFGESINVLFDAVQSAELIEKQISAINSLISE